MSGWMKFTRKADGRWERAVSVDAPGETIEGQVEFANYNEAPTYEARQHIVQKYGMWPYEVPPAAPTEPKTVGGGAILFSAVVPDEKMRGVVGHRYAKLYGTENRWNLPTVAELLNFRREVMDEAKCFRSGILPEWWPTELARKGYFLVRGGGHYDSAYFVDLESGTVHEKHNQLEAYAWVCCGNGFDLNYYEKNPRETK